jgi:hypothetical protein
VEGAGESEGVLPKADASAQEQPRQAELHGERAVPVKTRRRPEDPTDKEVAEHIPTHLPFRDWCKHCIFGKAPDWPHRLKRRDADEVPMVQVDYCFMNRRGDTDILTILTVVHCPSGGVAACIGVKGPAKYPIDVTTNFLQFASCVKIILRHDGENAIEAFSAAKFAKCESRRRWTSARQSTHRPRSDMRRTRTA